jgi:hypothetical protein
MIGRLLELFWRLLAFIGPQASELGDNMDSLDPPEER